MKIQLTTPLKFMRMTMPKGLLNYIDTRRGELPRWKFIYDKFEARDNEYILERIKWLQEHTTYVRGDETKIKKAWAEIEEALYRN